MTPWMTIYDNQDSEPWMVITNDGGGWYVDVEIRGWPTMRIDGGDANCTEFAKVKTFVRDVVFGRRRGIRYYVETVDKTRKPVDDVATYVVAVIEKLLAIDVQGCLSMLF